MVKLFSVIAIGLVIFWAIATIVFHAGSIVHVMLLVAAFSLLLRLSNRVRSFFTYTLYFAFFLVPSIVYFIVFLCRETSED